MTEASFCKNY